jgi:hypothetical protein
MPLAITLGICIRDNLDPIATRRNRRSQEFHQFVHVYSRWQMNVIVNVMALCAVVSSLNLLIVTIDIPDLRMSSVLRFLSRLFIDFDRNIFSHNFIAI